MESKVVHEPVLLEEVLVGLEIKVDGMYIDATLGAGGHSEAILGLGGKVLGIEADETMIKLSEERLAKSCPTLVRGNFENIVEIARSQNFAPVDGVLMDLGVSNFHYETLKRGFSFRNESEPLDMRLSEKDSAVTAATLLNVLSESQLLTLFEEVIGNHKARLITKQILRARVSKPFETVFDLKRAAREMAPEVFLALRIAVNTEFQVLENGIRGAYEILKVGGKLAVISFHSLEDKIVVRLFREFGGEMETKEPIVPSQEEVQRNSKSRSALLRIIRKS